MRAVAIAFLIVAMSACSSNPKYTAKAVVMASSTNTVEFGSLMTETVDFDNDIEVQLDLELLNSRKLIYTALRKSTPRTSLADSLLPFYLENYKADTAQYGAIVLTVSDDDPDRAVLFLEHVIAHHQDLKNERLKEPMRKVMEQVQEDYDLAKNSYEELENDLLELRNAGQANTAAYYELLNKLERERESYISIGRQRDNLRNKIETIIVGLLFVEPPHLVN